MDFLSFWWLQFLSLGFIFIVEMMGVNRNGHIQESGTVKLCVLPGLLGELKYLLFTMDSPCSRWSILELFKGTCCDHASPHASRTQLRSCIDPAASEALGGRVIIWGFPSWISQKWHVLHICLHYLYIIPVILDGFPKLDDLLAIHVEYSSFHLFGRASHLKVATRLQAHLIGYAYTYLGIFHVYERIGHIGTGIIVHSQSTSKYERFPFLLLQAEPLGLLTNTAKSSHNNGGSSSPTNHVDTRRNECARQPMLAFQWLLWKLMRTRELGKQNSAKTTNSISRAHGSPALALARENLPLMSIFH